jgi:hypothetical protein
MLCIHRRHVTNKNLSNIKHWIFIHGIHSIFYSIKSTKQTNNTNPTFHKAKGLATGESVFEFLLVYEISHFFRHVHTRSESYPVSCSIGYSGSVPATVPTGPRRSTLNSTYGRGQSRATPYTNSTTRLRDTVLKLRDDFTSALRFISESTEPNSTLNLVEKCSCLYSHLPRITPTLFTRPKQLFFSTSVSLSAFATYHPSLVWIGQELTALYIKTAVVKSPVTRPPLQAYSRKSTSGSLCTISSKFGLDRSRIKSTLHADQITYSPVCRLILGGFSSKFNFGTLHEFPKSILSFDGIAQELRTLYINNSVLLRLYVSVY